MLAWDLREGGPLANAACTPGVCLAEEGGRRFVVEGELRLALAEPYGLGLEDMGEREKEGKERKGECVGGVEP